MGSDQDSTAKYLVVVKFKVHGVVERSDIVGALFGQTEGLLGDDLDLRELQKSGRIGRIQVNHSTKNGLSKGEIVIPSSLDKVETAILAATIESVDRVGPCDAEMNLNAISDVREEKRQQIMGRAKELLQQWDQEISPESQEITDAIKDSIKIGEITKYGPDNLPAGPDVDSNDDLVIVEGRADVLNLLRCGIKNCIAVQGTSVPELVVELSKKKHATAFLDGDRGGDMILNELLQRAEIEFVARAPDGLEVEELTRKQLLKAYRGRKPIEAIASPHNKKYKKSPAKNKAKKSSKRSKNKRKSSSTKKGRHPSPKQSPRPEIPREFQAKLKELLGTNEAIGFDQNNKPVLTIGTLSLAKALENGDGNLKNVRTLIFDGILTQRIVDLSVKRNIEAIIASTVRKIKLPRHAKTKFYRFDDFM